MGVVNVVRDDVGGRVSGDFRTDQVCGSLGGQLRWAGFEPRIAGSGVYSALSLPLIVAGDVVGSLNV
jgi:hypothetical protein